MEMTSFALGMLTMVGLLFICLIVFGLVKVMKIQKNLGYFKNEFSDFRQAVYRDISNVENGFTSKIERDFNDTHRRFEQIEREISECHQKSCSYTDHRVDKLSAKKTEILND